MFWKFKFERDRPGALDVVHGRERVALVGGAAEDARRALRDAGFVLDNSMGHVEGEKLQFSKMGDCAPVFRASVIRVTTFKLLGSGIAAAFMSLNQHTGHWTSFSCALSATVNFIAFAHYWRIWKIREQTFGGATYLQFMAQIPRSGEEDALAQKRIVFQEEMVDGLRHSDWLCTLGTRSTTPKNAQKVNVQTCSKRTKSLNVKRCAKSPK